MIKLFNFNRTQDKREAQAQKVRNRFLKRGITKNIPITHEQIKNLPNGFTPTGVFPNNRDRRAAVNVNPHKMNNRKCTPGRKSYRDKEYGRLTPNQ